MCVAMHENPPYRKNQDLHVEDQTLNCIPTSIAFRALSGVMTQHTILVDDSVN